MRLLDLFSGAGGAGVGYRRAGWDVVGVDIDPQPAYPFAHRVMDWRDGLEDAAAFDAIHASPPCQGYSWSTRKGREERWPLRIAEVRDALAATGLPYVIENVANARRDMRQPVLLCGTMFGLGLIKHRLFESTADLWPVPGHPDCSGMIARGEAVTVAGHGGDSKDFRVSRWREAMGIDWMDRGNAATEKHDLAEAVPPAFTEWVGCHLMASLLERAA